LPAGQYGMYDWTLTRFWTLW